jgi:hypothetical protein
VPIKLLGGKIFALSSDFLNAASASAAGVDRAAALADTRALIALPEKLKRS